ncbi:hypothetical protein YC2023_120007 [Brassica napus]
MGCERENTTVGTNGQICEDYNAGEEMIGLYQMTALHHTCGLALSGVINETTWSSLVVLELQLECPPLDSSLDHCGNLHVGCSTRDRRPLHDEPHGDALAASMLNSVSSLDHLGRARILAIRTVACYRKQSSIQASVFFSQLYPKQRIRQNTKKVSKE